MQSDYHIITPIQITPTDLYKINFSICKKEIESIQTEINTWREISEDHPLTIGYLNELLKKIDLCRKKIDLMENFDYTINKSFIYKHIDGKLMLNIIYGNNDYIYINIDNIDFDILRTIYQRSHAPIMREVHEDLLANLLSLENIDHWKYQLSTYDMFAH